MANNNTATSSQYLRSKRETCKACNEREVCFRPCKDTEDEETYKYNCEKYRIK